MVHTGLAINKLEQGTENTFRGRDDNATVLQELSEKAMQERATLIGFLPSKFFLVFPEELKLGVKNSLKIVIIKKHLILLFARVYRDISSREIKTLNWRESP